MKFSIIATPAEVAELYSRLVSEELELNLDDCDDCDCACDCEDDADDAKPATLTVKFVSSDGKFSILDLMEKVKKNKRH